MDQKVLRLELLKLTYNHGRDAREAVERAEELEQYVLAGESSTKKPSVDRKRPAHLQK